MFFLLLDEFRATPDAKDQRANCHRDFGDCTFIFLREQFPREVCGTVHAMSLNYDSV